MKRMINLRKAVALLTATLLVVGLVPFSAFAGQEATLSLNVPLQVAGTREDPAMLTFTPAESGIYVLASQSIYDPQAYLWEEGGLEALLYADDTEENLQFRLAYYLEAGKTYVYEVDNRSETTPFTVTLTRGIAPQSVEILGGESITIPLLNGQFRLQAAVTPENADYTLAWDVADHDLLSVYGNNDNGYIQPDILGTTTVTVSAGEVSDTITVNVVKPTETLAMGSNAYVAKPDVKYSAYLFTPTESAEYRFLWHCEDNEDHDIVVSELLSDGQMSYVNEANLFAEKVVAADVYMDKDATYIITLWNAVDEETVTDLVVGKTVAATSLSFAEGTSIELLYGAVEEMYLTPLFAPDMASREEIVWTSSEETVATVDDMGCIRILDKGVTTITAESESGLTAAIQITVRGPLPIELGKEYTFTATDVVNFEGYTFTATKDAVYNLYMNADGEEAQIYLFGGEELVGSSSGNIFGMMLTAGVTYNINLWCRTGTAATFRLEEAPKASEIVLNTEEVVLQLIDSYYLDYEVLPQGALYGEVTYTSSDESVIKVDEGGRLIPMGPGTATVTATMEHGVSDTVTVTVKACLEWNALGTKHIILNPVNPVKLYRLTVEEDGWYEFVTDGSCNAELNLYVKVEDVFVYYNSVESEDGEPIAWTVCLLRDAEYYLAVDADEELIAYDLTWRKGEEPEASQEPDVPEDAFVLLKSEYTATVGDMVKAMVLLGEENWISDVRVEKADVAEACGDDIQLQATGVGTTTVTLVDAFENEVTLTLTVTAAETIEIGDTVDVALQMPLIGEGYMFVPEEDGVYAFGTAGTEDTYVELLDEEFRLVESSDDTPFGRNAYLIYELAAGETYYLLYTTYDFYYYGGEIEGTAEFEAFAVVPTPAEGAEIVPDVDTYLFEEDGVYYVALGEELYVDIMLLPNATAWCEDLDVESSDMDIAVGYDGWVETCDVGRVNITYRSEAGGWEETLTLQVIKPLLGDVNTDGAVDEEDVQLLADHLSGKTDLGRRLYFAQMNEDEAVDAKDLTLLKERIGMPVGMIGDVDGNGKADSTDARLTLQYAVKKISADTLNLDMADVDGNGKVDSTDARLILQFAVKKISKFPVER